MYLEKDIVKEGAKVLKEVAKKVPTPLSKDDLECALGLFQYLVISENDELCKRYGLRPGVGIAAPQVGRSIRMFAINATDFLDEEQKKYAYVFINPTILAKSKEMTYLPGGEGCLSVDRPTNGLVTPRHYAIKVKSQILDINTKKLKTITLNLEGYPAIVFQHEYDHLDGIMYVDKMFKEKDLDSSIVPLYTVEEDEDENNNEK